MKFVEPKYFHIPKDASIELIVLVLNEAGLNVNNDPVLESRLRKLGSIFD